MKSAVIVNDQQSKRPASDLVDDDPVRQCWPRQMVDYSGRNQMMRPRPCRGTASLVYDCKGEEIENKATVNVQTRRRVGEPQQQLDLAVDGLVL